MGLDQYWHGEKELSPKSIKERKLIEQLNKYPFTYSDLDSLKNDYLYISEWSTKPLYDVLNNIKFTGQLGEIKGLKKHTDKMGIKHWTIITDAWYLRKANAIHQWFVSNAQDGIDDCGCYPIDDVLESFIEQSGDVLNGKLKPDDAIPTQSGFFFGGTEYDEWYYRRLRQTRNRFKQFTAKCRKDKWKYFYYSSW